jgi:phosphatidylglycerophosphate synthase
MAGPFQVLILSSRRLVAGLPPGLRSADRARAELPGARVTLWDCGAAWPRRYRRQLASLGARCAAEDAPEALLEPGMPVLVLDGEGFPKPGALAAFLERARAAGGPARWVSGARAVAAWLPAAPSAATAPELLSKAGGAAVALDGWLGAFDDASAAAAERELFASLPKDTDGYIARLDRRLSITISAALLGLPVTPNDITTASLVLGLLGAWWLASGSYGLTVAGAALLWFCCLLDGCDGEVARLKLLCSPSGAAYDLAADHVAHLATFVAIPVGVHRALPQASFKLPGVLLVSGFLACMFSVWYLVLRKPENERGRHALLIERVASRDYVYLILLLALLGRLDWFLYAAGVGSHVFWAALWLLEYAPAPAVTAAKRTPAP